MDFALNNMRSDRTANANGNSMMLRFRDFVSSGYIEKELNFGQRLDAIAEAEARGDVYLDFEHIKCLYAADVGKIVLVWKRLKVQGRRLVLCNVEPFVWELLHLTRLETLMEIHRDRPFFSVEAIEPTLYWSPNRANTLFVEYELAECLVERVSW